VTDYRIMKVPGGDWFVTQRGNPDACWKFATRAEAEEFLAALHANAK
jgi:hypothetical protein